MIYNQNAIQFPQKYSLKAFDVDFVSYNWTFSDIFGKVWRSLEVGWTFLKILVMTRWKSPAIDSVERFNLKFHPVDFQAVSIYFNYLFYQTLSNFMDIKGNPAFEFEIDWNRQRRTNLKKVSKRTVGNNLCLNCNKFFGNLLLEPGNDSDLNLLWKEKIYKNLALYGYHN